MTPLSEGKDNPPSMQPPVVDPDSDLLLHRGQVTPYNIRKELGWDRTSHILNTNSVYSGLVDLQDNLEA
ncbi:hypothetical protein CDL15_Pgr019706 [Punica granatum]|uniref:Uncharacterized protein n=1 Tax=Punica granatum TaxID=22663 RepID=A0A218X6V9_PUNGR|nr:hypothetical protein CDL15_Pgr019706 [Punica granatum]